MTQEHDPAPASLPKDLVAASAAPLILGILMRGESYGYAILAEVRKLSQGRLEWKEGMLYPVLHRMERNEWIVAELRDSPEGRLRRYYRITQSGRRILRRQKAEWSLVNNLLELAWGSP